MDFNSCEIFDGSGFRDFLLYFLHRDDTTHERLVADFCDESTEGLKL